ncbi:MAG: bifunctional UDP-N-acetylglucosamine diphosphorylase/glucosamine-1-phosphate N-acetyltransferase GlmU [Nitrospirae bacterium]|nr:bifunctional UDP-N-acetylglucosamine diphosphorylase/glucosamine-1-phosphate N-acetyltransferase GlmU [Nitrospirota bacterium]
MELSVVILAAGLGKRMKSLKPKVLHEALGKPMLQHVMDAVMPLKPVRTVIVAGSGADAVMKEVTGSGLSFVIQKRLLGTGDALSTAKKELSRKGTILVLNGDCPLITTKTLRTFLLRHRRGGNCLSYLSFVNDSLSGYGRTIRDGKGRVAGIIEDKHASVAEKAKFREFNGGVYVMEHEALGFLNRIKRNPSSGEYYLTDLIAILLKAGKKVDTYICPEEDILGVNSREDLCRVSKVLQERVISGLLKKGVTFTDPSRSLVHSRVTIGKDTVIYPNTYIEGKSSIGSGCVIYPGSRIIDSIIGDDVKVKDNSLIEKSIVKKGASIGPMAHLRPESVIGSGAKVGNFVEIKKSTLGRGVKASHLSYLGDAVIGDDVNIGAGTITCNYDGRKKHKTVIGTGAFVGSDTQFVAPVTVGKGAYVGAGSTITKDVPDFALGVSRSEQKNIAGWGRTNKLKVKSVMLKVKGK